MDCLCMYGYLGRCASCVLFCDLYGCFAVTSMCGSGEMPSYNFFDIRHLDAFGLISYSHNIRHLPFSAGSRDLLDFILYCDE